MERNSNTMTTLRDLLHIVFKRKVRLLLFFGITVFVVVLATFAIKPTYEATSEILVKVGRENVYVPEVASGSNLNPVIEYNRDEQVNSEIQIIKSRALAEKVVESLGPAAIFEDLNAKDDQGFATELALLKFEKALNVEGIKKSNVIEVGFKHTDPIMAANVVNKLVDLYLERHVDIHKRSRSSKFFQEQSQALKDKLEQEEARLQAFKKLHNITSLNEQRTILLQKETELRALLEQILSQEAETAGRIAQLRQQLSITPKTIPQSEDTEHSPYLIDTLQNQLVELELKEKELLNKYTEQSRLVSNVRDEIQMVRKKMIEQESKKYERSSFGLNVTYQRLEEDIFQNEAELEALKAKKETQSGQLDGYEKKLEDINLVEVELNRLQETVEINRQNYRLYLEKFEESRISDAMDIEKISNVTQIQPARPPLKPVSPKVLVNLVLGIFLGAIGGLGLAFSTEYFDERLEKPEVAEDVLDLPVLGCIPILETS